jgi:hypothetical protein
LFARRAEKDAARAEAEAAVLQRIDYLSEGELRYVADALRRGEQSFTAWVDNSHVASLEMKRFIISATGKYNTNSFPFVFDDFVWRALLARKTELIAKDDENQRKAQEEEAPRARRRA